MVKMSLVILSVGLFSSVVVKAAELKLDVRSDAQTTRYSEEVRIGSSPTDPKQPDSSSFKINRLRLELSGRLGEYNSYRLRTDFLKANQAVNEREGASEWIDMAYVSRTIAEGVKLNFGKFPSGAGGWEGMVSSGDFYLASQAYRDISGTAPLDPDSQSTNILYVTGVGVEYWFGTSKLTAIVANPGTNITGSGGEVNQDRNLWGLRYSGRLLEGILQPVITYFNEDRDFAGATRFNFMSVGGKFSLNDFDFETDYLMNLYKGRTTRDNDDRLTTYYALVRYRFKTLHPHLKYEISNDVTKEDANTERKTEITGLTVALEYVPVREELFRYHVAFTERRETPDIPVGSAARVTQNFYVGVRAVADILK